MKQNKIKVLTDKEHVLLKPNMYIGGIEEIEDSILFLEDNGVELKAVKYVPGLYKIIMEIFDNSVDEAIRTNFKYSTHIKVTVTDKSVTIEDNGRGLPQEIFEDGEPAGVKAVCELRAGTNFIDETKAISSIGTNGVGSALTNIFSKKFIMNTYNRKSHLYLECSDNLSLKKWNIMKSNKKSGTKIYFEPDLERFGLDRIDDVYINLFHQHIIHLVQVFPEIHFELKSSIKTKEVKVDDLF